eukprot:UN26267
MPRVGTAKREPEQEKEVLDWISAVLGEQLSGPYEEVLKDGQVLCRLINVLKPGSVKKVNKKGMAFQMMENITAFLAGCKGYGVPDEELFQTVDLWEKRDVGCVTKSLYAIGRYAQKNQFNGPVLGPKMAEGEKREWTDEQLRAGQNVIGLQYGTNKGASQAGMNMGKGRKITD